MGLEIVDIACQLDDRLGIEIGDKDLFEVETMNDFHNYLVRRMPEITGVQDTRRCLSSHVFYRLRRSLCAITGLPRTSFTPATTLDDVRRRSRVESLREPLASDLGLEMPDSGWSRLCTSVMLSFVALVVTAYWLALQTYDGLPASRFAWIVSIALGFALGYYVAGPLRPDFAGRYQTVGDLAGALITWNNERLREEHGKLTESDLWTILQEITVYCTNVKREDVQKDTKLKDIMG